MLLGNTSAQSCRLKVRSHVKIKERMSVRADIIDGCVMT